MDSLVRSDDRLSSRADKALFLTMFVIGTTLMLVEKAYQLSPVWPMATGAVFIVMFGVLAWRTPRLRLREDRVGDGAYYLGFLFTLVSLAWALWEFNTAGGTEAVIRGFGVALVTTIVGIVCRVVFQQLREDPVEYEQEARASLSQSVGALEHEIRQGVEGLILIRNRTNQEMSEAIGEGMRAVLKEHRDSLKQMTDTFSATMASAMESVRQTIEAVVEQAAETKRATGRVVLAMGKLADRLEAAPGPADALRPKIQALASLLEEIGKRETQRLQAQQESAEAVVRLHTASGRAVQAAAAAAQNAKAIAAGLEAAMKSAAAAIEQLNAGLARVTEDADGRVKEHRRLLDQVGQMVAGSEKELERLRERLSAQVLAATDRLTEIQHQTVAAATTITRELRAK